MTLDELRNDIILKQKKGLPFIASSVLIWLLIAIVTSLDLKQTMENSYFCLFLPSFAFSMADWQAVEGGYFFQ